MSNETQTQETTKKPSGLAEFHARKKLEKEQQAGLSKETKVLNTELKEERKEQDSLKVEGFFIDPNVTYVFQTIQKSSSPRHEILGSRCKVFDGTRIRQTRYLPFADTIWVDEQGNRYDEADDAVLAFNRDMITVEGTDTRLMEYMLSHDEYDGNKNRLAKTPPKFTLVNKPNLEQAKEALYSAKLKALNIINDSAFGEILPIARVVFNIMDTDETTVKNKLREYAEKDPNKILTNYDSPRVKRAFVIQAAFDKGIIELDAQNKSVVWGSTRALVTEVNATKDLEALLREVTDFSFTENGNKTYDILKQKLVL